MTRIMIIRHAEKPGQNHHDHGVTQHGAHDHHDLTVRGWQRAGALVRYFAPAMPHAPGSPIATPATIFASAATLDSPSKRAKHTARPLAAMLGIAVDDRFENHHERALAAAALEAPGPVLIVWHHHSIVRLAHAIGGGDLACPGDWPDDCFDVVWVLDRADDGRWSVSVVAQHLLAGDRPPSDPSFATG